MRFILGMAAVALLACAAGPTVLPEEAADDPAPVAATFTLGPHAGTSSLSTRVRVDSYTNVHAVAELSDGKLYGVAAFVKASGGCSAPAAKNADEAQANLGQMKLRQFARAGDAPAGGMREAQIMIRHPN